MPDDVPLLDTNVVLRHVAGDHAEHSPRARALFLRIAAGGLRARLLDQALFEAAFTLTGMYRASRGEVRDALLSLIELPGIIVRSKPVWRTALTTFAESRLSLVDAYQVAVMQHSGITRIISFDRDFDRVPGVTRIEP